MYIWKTHVKIYYIPKLTNSHKWLCTNDIFLSKIRKLFRNDNLQKIDGYLLNNPNHQTKPCQHKSERLISCFSLPALVLKHYTYWCKSLVIENHRTTTKRFWWFRRCLVHSLVDSAFFWFNDLQPNFCWSHILEVH